MSAPVAPDRTLVVIARTRHKMVQVELEQAVAQGAKFLELRLDYLSKAVDFQRLKAYKKCPWVATIRRPPDGGRWSGSEAERQTILRQIIVSGLFEWVDLETDIADGIRRFGKVQRVVSYHNLQETPADLGDVYERMCDQDADVIKIAVMANTPADCFRVLELQKNATKPTIAFCMGALGFWTRIVGLKYGAPWTYAAFNRERGVAPGLPTYHEIKTTYPVRSIGPETKIYGLLGDPVEQSYSPVLHNHTYKKLGVDAVYVPFLVPKEHFGSTVSKFHSVPVSGYSVTIPHKEEAAKLAGDDADEAVAATGAANTLVRTPAGSFRGYNTDLEAAVDSIEDGLAQWARPGSQFTVRGLSVLILGVGGAARAIAYGLHKDGARVRVVGRDPIKARALASSVGCGYIDWAQRNDLKDVELLVNCTPVGMYPNLDECPIDPEALHADMAVFDTIYNPNTTMLLRAAEDRGCHPIGGAEMFVRQAAAQVEHFTGAHPDHDLMRKVLRKAMSPLNQSAASHNDDHAGGDDD